MGVLAQPVEDYRCIIKKRWKETVMFSVIADYRLQEKCHNLNVESYVLFGGNSGDSISSHPERSAPRSWGVGGEGESGCTEVCKYGQVF